MVIVVKMINWGKGNVVKMFVTGEECGNWGKKNVRNVVIGVKIMIVIGVWGMW